MKSPIKYHLTIQNKTYYYTIAQKDAETSWVECPAANIRQEFLNEDIPALLLDLPELIVAEKTYRKTQSSIIRFRVSMEDKKTIEQRAVQHGYTSVSQFLRDLGLGLLRQGYEDQGLSC